MSSGRLTNDLIDRVLGYTAAIDMERDLWERSSAMTAVIRWGDKDAIEAIRGWLDRSVELQNSNGDLGFRAAQYYPAGHAGVLTPTSALPSSKVYPLLLLHEHTGEAGYREAAERQVEALVASERTSEGGFVGRKEHKELWIDYVYMFCPGLARLGRLSDRADLVDEAYKQIEVQARRLVDPVDNLARHAWREAPNSYPQSTFWSRGNGWLVCGLVDTLDEAPDHAQADETRDLFVRVMGALANLQDRSGYLRHVVDDPDERFESSGTSMFAYAAARGVEQGLLDEDYRERAIRAVDAVSGSVDADGAVQGTSVPPGGPGVAFGATPFGQGFFLQATHALRDHLNL